jgi:hypothetical protein
LGQLWSKSGTEAGTRRGLVYGVGSAIVSVLLAGAQFTFQAVLADLGVQ